MSAHVMLMFKFKYVYVIYNVNRDSQGGVRQLRRTWKANYHGICSVSIWTGSP